MDKLLNARTKPYAPNFNLENNTENSSQPSDYLKLLFPPYAKI